MLALIALLILLIVVFAVTGWVLSVVLWAALVGAVIGGLARLIIPGRQAIGVFQTVLLGWIGSLAGGVIGRHVLHRGGFVTLLCEITVAVILVGIASASSGKVPARQS